MTEALDAVVIGAGPAGLMAAEVLASTGRKVTVFDAMPSVGRKFLMAGKSGLNLTKDEGLDAHLSHYSSGNDVFLDAVRSFGPEAIKGWALGLGQEIFTGSSDRVFPRAMKASPLLRAWLARLDQSGVQFQSRCRWTGWAEDALTFKTPDGPRRIVPAVTVLALGGASWARLGSDGAWATVLADKGVPISPFAPANMGFHVPWSEFMAPHFGSPIKGTALRAGTSTSRGEWIVSARGIEGGGIYDVSKAMREGADLVVDLLPGLSVGEIAARLAKNTSKLSLSNQLRKALKLDVVQRALLMEFGRPLPAGPDLAALIKALPIKVDGPRPIDQAISVAGGVSWSGVDETLMLRALPGTFVAGEMLDWEAPTGGYLLTGCFATGRLAGKSAAAWTR